MKKVFSFLFQFLLIVITAIAQPKDLPGDYLTKEFHASRREALRQLMPANSVAVIFAFPERTFSNDVSYPYHQNPDLYYFSGYKEPRAVLFIFKEQQTTADSKKYNELFFVQKRDAQAEMWTGRRLGVEQVQTQLGVEMVFNGSAFNSFPVDFSKFDKILFEGLPEGAVDNQADSADLFSLVNSFKQKAGVPPDFDKSMERMLGNFANNTTMQTLPNFITDLNKRIASGTVKNGQVLNGVISVDDILAVKDSLQLKAVKEKISAAKLNTGLYNKYISTLRQIKTPEEVILMRKVGDISCMAHNEVMKAIEPGMSEFDLQGLHEYVHKKYGSEWVGYPSIVGGGENGCILHYIENTKTKVGNDLVLMDVGAEYHGYSADVTRTVPANGKFTPVQKEIYDLVYKAQEAVFAISKEGTPFSALNEKAKEVLTEGLINLGIIKTKEELRRYYPHGCSHFLGLDVHDKGIYQGSLMANMVITVEPGIYIPENSPCDKKWWGIAVRIEDDILIEKDGFELLSHLSPRSSLEVEKMTAEKSVINKFVLPDLPGAK